MTSKQLGTVIQRAISDGAFRRQLQSDPTSALRGFDLTPDEVAAIRGGDPTTLSSLGVDQRLSKTFAFGDAVSSLSRNSSGGDLNASGSTALSDRGAASGQDAISDLGRPDGQALVSDGNADGMAHDAARFGGGDGTRDAIVGDPASGRTLPDDAPVNASILANDSSTTFGDRYDDAPAGTTSVAASAEGGGYGDAFITADEAGRYGVTGHTDATVTADAGGDADLSQTVISAGSVDAADAHGTGDALSSNDDSVNDHSWG